MKLIIQFVLGVLISLPVVAENITEGKPKNFHDIKILKQSDKEAIDFWNTCSYASYKKFVVLYEGFAKLHSYHGVKNAVYCLSAFLNYNPSLLISFSVERTEWHKSEIPQDIGKYVSEKFNILPSSKIKKIVDYIRVNASLEEAMKEQAICAKMSFIDVTDFLGKKSGNAAKACRLVFIDANKQTLINDVFTLDKLPPAGKLNFLSNSHESEEINKKLSHMFTKESLSRPDYVKKIFGDLKK